MKLDQAANIYIKAIPALGFIFLISILTSYVIPRTNLTVGTDPSYWGAFGDYVGGILNPIFGIFTLLGLVITVWLQKEILEVQKQELADTRAELAKSAEALDIQNKTMLAQNFEGTFFQMLRRQSELLANLEFKYRQSTNKPVMGLDAIDICLRQLNGEIKQGHGHIIAFEKLYKEQNATIGPYFRNLYHTLKLINENKHLTDEEKINYGSLARAQLSSSELTLIFYNCLTEVGKGLKPLLVKYRMLKHIDKNQLINPEMMDDANHYPPETYLARD